MHGFMGELYTNAKPALWERPYFQIFALKQHLEERHTLLETYKSCKQLSTLSNTISVTNKLIEFVKLSTWWLAQTNGYSYPRVMAIWIDVHPTGENPTNTTRTLPTPVHVRPAYASCGQSSYVTTFHKSSTELDRVTAPEKKRSRCDPQHAGWLIRGSPPSFSPPNSHSSSGESQTSFNE